MITKPKRVCPECRNASDKRPWCVRCGGAGFLREWLHK